VAISADLEAQLLAALKEAGRDVAHDVAHDAGHVRRVWKNAVEIATGEGVEPTPVLMAAAYLHDIVSLPKDHSDRAKSSVLASRRAWTLVREMGLPREDCDAVAHAVAAHSFSGGIEPQTVEAKILRDADRLEALGAIGIARVFAVSGGLNRALWDGDDPFAEGRSLDDTRFALDHFKAKLLGLAVGMTTRTGRNLAEARTALMHRYLGDLAVELRRD